MQTLNMTVLARILHAPSFGIIESLVRVRLTKMVKLWFLLLVCLISSSQYHLDIAKCFILMITILLSPPQASKGSCALKTHQGFVPRHHQEPCGGPPDIGHRLTVSAEKLPQKVKKRVPPVAATMWHIHKPTLNWFAKDKQFSSCQHHFILFHLSAAVFSS